jgi:nucleoid-associated protein YgaU
VTTLTDPVYSMVKIEPTRHAPPIVTFMWGQHFPGGELSDFSGSQRRTEFRGLVESVRQKFTLFSPEGVPLRATLTLSLREYKTLDQQLDQLNLSSPDRTHGHVVQQGETLAAIAQRYYGRATDWRPIAENNGIEDPRRLLPGTVLAVPTLY